MFAIFSSLPTLIPFLTLSTQPPPIPFDSLRPLQTCEPPLLMFAMEIQGKTDRPLKECLPTLMVKEVEGREDADAYMAQADEEGVELARLAFDKTIEKGKDRPGEDVEWLLFTVLSFGFFDEEWNVPKLLIEALLGDDDFESDDSSSHDMEGLEEFDNDNDDGDDDKGDEAEEDDGSSFSNNNFEVVD